jgi:2-oxoisovalerate dehydrogenase E1 component
VRTSRAPATLLIGNVPRRFGHAATDRQFAYLTEKEIKAQLERDPVVDAVAAAVHAGVFPSIEHALAEYQSITEMAAAAFAAARSEPREMTEAGLVARCAPPRRKRQAVIHSADGLGDGLEAVAAPAADATAGLSKPVEMRPLMTHGLTALMADNERVVYLGEDVEHGGYYRVTEGLKDTYGRRRIFDWPPDEASLIGAGIGLAQSGRLPIVEVPYAAYLSCGYNQFVEACFLHWLSDGKQPNGMVIRMQGFDEGVFGGHFHTANAPPVFGIPGLDVLCFSNGRDWVRVRQSSSRRPLACVGPLACACSGHRAWFGCLPPSPPLFPCCASLPRASLPRASLPRASLPRVGARHACMRAACGGGRRIHAPRLDGATHTQARLTDGQGRRVGV